MSVIELFPNIYQITMPTPFPVGDVHAYLLRGEPLTLIDTGLNYPPSERILRAGLAEIGVAAADLEQIVLSHSHLDHFGLARRLQMESGAPVLAHPGACAKVADLHAYVQHGVSWAEKFLGHTGLPESQYGWVKAFYGVIPQMAEDVRVGRCLVEGDTLEAGGSMWQVLFCPGHSGDLICFYRAEDKLLLGNDHLLAHISSNALLEPPRPGEGERRLSLIQYWRSLDRLDALPIAVVLPGHGAVINDHRGLLTDRRQQRDRRLARITALIADAPLDAWQIGQAMFPNLNNIDVFLVLSEVIGHLDILQEVGKVVAVENEQSGTLQYQRISS